MIHQALNDQCEIATITIRYPRSRPGEGCLATLQRPSRLRIKAWNSRNATVLCWQPDPDAGPITHLEDRFRRLGQARRVLTLVHHGYVQKADTSYRRGSIRRVRVAATGLIGRDNSWEEVNVGRLSRRLF